MNRLLLTSITLCQIALLATSCSLKRKDGNANVHLAIQDSKSAQATQDILSTFDLGGTIGIRSAPTTVSAFDCMTFNIVGPGITSRNHPGEEASVLPNLTAGTADRAKRILSALRKAGMEAGAFS